MRAARDAVVDTMGCERSADPAADAPTRRFQTLVSLMLSSQTKDQVTFACMQRLLAAGLTASRLAAASEAEIAALLSAPPAVGFWRKKAVYLRAAAQHCAAAHGGDIPPTLEGLLALAGVGPKMAHICMTAAWGRSEGIGVDTHVHRIANRLGWVRTAMPEQTRAALEALLPREEWAELNVLLVGFGQQRCTPVAPQCEGCLARSSCPTGLGQLAASPKRRLPDW